MRVATFLLIIVICSASLAQPFDIDSPPNVQTDSERSKISSTLLSAEKEIGSKAADIEDVCARYGLRTRGDSIQVRVLLNVLPDEAHLGALTDCGCTIQRHRDHSVQILIPSANLRALENLSIVEAIDRPNYPIELSVISEGLDTLGIPPYHSHGFAGQGLKVAIVDGGFQDYSMFLGSDLPSIVNQEQWGWEFEGDSDHGTKCAQLVFDIAPGAEMWLLQFDTYMEFLDVLNWIGSHDIDIVSCSMGWIGEGWPDGSSAVSQKIENLKNSGVLWVQAAGDHARKHWRGAFNDPNFDGFHNFYGNDVGNSFTAYPGDVVTVSLFWDDYPASDQNFDLYIAKASGGQIVAKSENLQTGFQYPYERIVWSPAISTPEQYFIAIKKFIATDDPIMHLFWEIDSDSTDDGPEYVTEDYSILLPGDSRGALTIGAVPYTDAGTIENFSSRGPTEDSRTKPDLVAPDGISVMEYVDIVKVFGTSFACPHVAGAAACYLSKLTSVVPAAVSDSFRTMGIDVGPEGADNTYGHGLLHVEHPNAAPVFQPLSDTSVYENESLTFSVIAEDPEGYAVTVTAGNLPPGATFDSTYWQFSWTPTYYQSGHYSDIVFTATDGERTSQESIDITVHNVNRAPSIAPLDELMDVAEGHSIGFVVNVSDPDPDSLTVTASNIPEGATFIEQHRQFLWTPNYEQAGYYSDIVFTVSDGELFDSDTVDIIVWDDSRPPVVQPLDDMFVLETENLSFTVNAYDLDGDYLSVSADNLPPGATFDTIDLNFSWTPGYDQAGYYTDVVFSAFDGGLYGRDTINITVLNVNRFPEAFSLLLPIDGDTVMADTTKLVWQVSSDPDPEDNILYQILYSEDDSVSWQSHTDDCADTQFCLTELNERSMYYWKIMAVDDHDTSTQCESVFSFFVSDVTAPAFTTAILANSVLHNELDIYAFPSETLVSPPFLSVVSTEDSQGVDMTQLTEREALTYVADFRVTHPDVYTVTVCGSDDFDNYGCSDRSFSAAPVIPDSPLHLSSPSGLCRLCVPGSHIANRGLVILLENAVTSSMCDGAAIPIGFEPEISVEIRTQSSILASGGSLHVRFDEAYPGTFAPGRVAVVYVENGSATIMQSRYSDSRTELIAEISQPGTYLVCRTSDYFEDDFADYSRPGSFRLYQNSPNPFNSRTEISFDIDRPSHVQLIVYNVLGQRVDLLADQLLETGSHRVSWDGRDERGKECGSGIYFYTLKSDGKRETRRMLLLK